MPKKVRQINYEERNGKKRVLFLVVLLIVVLLGSVTVMALIPYLNTLPLYRSYFKVFNSSYLTETTALTPDNALVLSSKNSDGNYETMTFTSTDSNVEIGNYEEPHYLFADKGGVDSNVTIVFDVEGKDAVDIICHIYLSDETGENIIMLSNDEVTTDKVLYFTAFFEKEEDIYISTVTMSYKLRIK